MNIIEVIEGFLSYVYESKPLTDSELNEFIFHLDKLALTMANLEFVFDETEYPDAPEKNYNDTYKTICSRFPMLGYYNVVANISKNIVESEVCVGDAIDDIADIVGDLEQVLWYFRNTSKDNALWHYQESFKRHWGTHLRELQLCLHDICY